MATNIYDSMAASELLLLRRAPDGWTAKDAAVPTYYDIGWDETRPVTQEIVDIWQAGIHRLVRERDDARDVLAAKDDEIAMLRQALAAKDARIGELKSVLACTPVAFEDPDAKPAPVPSFLTVIRRGNKAVIGMVTGRGDMPAPTCSDAR